MVKIYSDQLFNVYFNGNVGNILNRSTQSTMVLHKRSSLINWLMDRGRGDWCKQWLWYDMTLIPSGRWLTDWNQYERNDVLFLKRTFSIQSGLKSFRLHYNWNIGWHVYELGAGLNMVGGSMDDVETSVRKHALLKE